MFSCVLLFILSSYLQNQSRRENFEELSENID